MARDSGKARARILRLRGSAPQWAVALGIYALSRLWSTALLLGWFDYATQRRLRLGNAGLHADFWGYLNSWDAKYFVSIAEAGYPMRPPVLPDGHLAGSAWAFLPLFPALVRALTSISPLSTEVAAIALATLAGAAAAVALAGLLAPRIGRAAALWATTLFCFGPVSFLLQVGYSESLFVFLAFATLIALTKRRYLLVLGLGVATAFARPGALALAVAVGVHVVLRLRAAAARGTRAPAADFPRRQLVAATIAGAGIAAAGLAWPVIVGAITGIPDAYTQTELAWWAPSVGYLPLVPLTPWFAMAHAYLGFWGAPLVVAAVLAAIWWFRRRSLRRLGPEIMAFSTSYALYIFAVFLPQQSLFRILLLPLAPLAGDAAIVGRRRRALVALGVSLLLQPVAVVLLWSVWFP